MWGGMENDGAKMRKKSTHHLKASGKYTIHGDIVDHKCVCVSVRERATNKQVSGAIH